MEKSDVPINEITLSLCPELLAAAHKKKILDLFLVWSVAKAVDAKLGRSGVITTESLRRIMFQVLPIREHYTFKKLEKGIGLFWNRPGGKRGEKRVGLWSLTRILREGILEPDMPPCRPFQVSVAQLREHAENTGQEELRAWLLGMVRARHGGARPVSNFAHNAQIGVSRSTTQRHRRLCGALTTVQNWVCVYSAANEPRATYVRAQLNEKHGNGTKPYCVVQDHTTNAFSVARRLPNSYILGDAEQTSFRKRPRELRDFDVRSLEKMREQHYVRNDLNPKHAHSRRTKMSTGRQFRVRGYGYVVYGGEQSIGRGKVCLWECPEVERQEGESVDAYLERVVGAVSSPPT